MSSSAISLVLHLTLVTCATVRILLRAHRTPSSRIAWIVVILSVPVLGVLAYLLLGEVNEGRLRRKRLKETAAKVPPIPPQGPLSAVPFTTIPDTCRPPFQVGKSISGFEPVQGNTATLLHSSNATIDALVGDIDAAKDHVHVLFYIWLDDTNGTKVARALMRAAQRGVRCRAMADGLGSRKLTRSSLWEEMEAAGVSLARAMPLGRYLPRLFAARVDLRNHRKIMVIDNRITYCGSQNCADPEFRVKAKYAPWVDAVVRFEGPIALQNQRLFVLDWMAATEEDLSALLKPVSEKATGGFAAQAFGTGPSIRNSAMPEMFESAMHCARTELILTTPYYVPNESMQSSLCATAYRGVAVTLILPERNDSWIVAAASRSYYQDLLTAGVKLFEYRGGLLHAKTLTVDGKLVLIGSANMDRRSFDLNYENNILLVDAEMAGALRARQMEYLSQSSPVTREQVIEWPMQKRLWNNAIAMLGPVL